MTVKKHHPTDATIPRPTQPPRVTTTKSPLEEAEQAIANARGREPKISLENIARRNGLPRDLIRHAAARMDAAFLVDENKQLRAVIARLSEENRRLSIEVNRLRRLKNRARVFVTRTG